MIHIYCGDGKGKTTCAMGLALRALGREMSVVVAQFLKGSTSGEILQLEKIDGVRIFRLEEELPFTFQMSSEQKNRALQLHNRIFQKAIHFVNAGYCDMLILDELLSALETELIDSKMVMNFLESINNKVEVVITGRNPPENIIDLADYITEMRLQKHPFEKGVPAREGIEY